MNADELQALVIILQRAPVTPAERLWLGPLIDRLANEVNRSAAAEQAVEPSPNGVEREVVAG